MVRDCRWGVLSILILAPGLLGAAPDDGRLELVSSLQRADLDGVNGLTITPDGKYLHAASWKGASVSTFARDATDGKLDHRQTIIAPDVLGGATSLAVSPDGRLALASAFRSRAAVLFLRNGDTGSLDEADAIFHGERGAQLVWPIRAAFSADSKFAYILDDGGRGVAPGAVVTFRIVEGRLEVAHVDEGKDRCYDGARGHALHPDGRTLVVACSRAGTLVVADCDLTTGKTSVRQVIKDDEGDAHLLAGAFGVAVSPDGRFAYVTSGRFGGDDGVSVFRFDADRRLEFVQEFRNGKDDLRDFVGGNQIAVSPDGLNVYATATRSGTVASFRREPASGKLEYLETVADGGDRDRDRAQLGAAGIAISPDGRSVYVATEDSNAISLFRRKPDRSRP